MTTVEEGLQAQVRNIEATYGRSIGDWVELIRASGKRRHGEIVSMLKIDYGLSHGSANRVALVALDAINAKPVAADPATDLYPAARQHLLPIHHELMARIAALGPDIEVAPKKGYLSIRRRKQFAMLKPAARHVDVGLNLQGQRVGGRLESAATFNALFTHRVRIGSIGEIDDELAGWLSDAYDRAG
ncbi:MAG TPA: DUF5655 domain-containing protein [Candidatus Limnocylindrales bacterium]|nr:DUF5655 domain-containing protein [Candidatus Limnocylindrales bacterium]